MSLYCCKPSLRISARIWATLILFILSWGAAHSEPWPTTKFKVDFRIPAHKVSEGIEGYPPIPEPGIQTSLEELPAWSEAVPPDSEVPIDAHEMLAAYFEKSLEEVAGILREEGFEPPALPLFKDDSGVYFKVHVFDFYRTDNVKSTSSGISYTAKEWCGDYGASDTAYIALNASDFVPLTTTKEPFLYIVLAHELFHAVQANYPPTMDALMGCGAKTKDFVTVKEGSADAVAEFLASRHWPQWFLEYNYEREEFGAEGESIIFNRYSDGSRLLDRDLIGFRSYQDPFLDVSAFSGKTGKKYAPYRTSSFWLNVIERYGIRFMDFLYRQPLAYGDYPSLSEWLDDALKEYKPDSHGLYTVFPHFVAEFASYPGSRIPIDRFPNLDPVVLGKNPGPASNPLLPLRPPRTRWIEEILGKCKRVELVGGQTKTAAVKMALKKVSAGCIEIKWKGFDNNFAFDIEAEHDNLALLDQVSIGFVYQESNEQKKYCYHEVKRNYAEPLWTCLHEKPFQNTGAQPLSYAKIWREIGQVFSGEGRRIIAVSNVARHAEKTVHITKEHPVTIRIGVAETNSNDSGRYDPGTQALGGSMGMPTPGMSKETLYGIAQTPGIAGILMNINLPVTDSGRAYALAWMGKEPSMGYTGPFKGTVSANTGYPAVTSLMCARHRNGVVGKITRYDRDHLWIDIDADLCEMKVPPPSNGVYPKVDEIKATVKLPFGWRFDPGTAPSDIVTPGMQVHIDRHAKKMPRILAGQWPGDNSGQDSGGAAANTTSASGAGAPQGSGTDSTNGQGSSATGAIEPCACTCEELFANEARGEQLKAHSNAGEEVATAEMMNLNRCVSPCQREYMICHLEAGQARKQARKQAREAEKAAIRESCACSCDELAIMDQRGLALQARHAAGETISIPELMDVMRCVEVCETEYTGCRLSPQ